MLRKLIQHINKRSIFVAISSDAQNVGARNICTTACLRKSEKDLQSPKNIIVDKDKNVTLIGINRPQVRNAINAATASQLCEAFTAFEADETSPVAVLYGIGGSFCAGYDILELGKDGGEQVSIDILMAHEGSVGPTRRHIQKPVVCGISGYCIANGLELALMCDLRVMEETAVLGFFNRRFGVPVIDGGTARLPAIIGFSRALDLILTGRQVCADEALSMGVVNRVVPPGQSLIKSVELAQTLAKFPQRALNHDRNSLYSAVFDAANFNQAVQNEVMYTSKEIIEEMQQGIKWFIQTFKSDTTHSWLKREKSMADWDDKQLAAAAEQKEAEKQAVAAARIEAEKKSKEPKQKSDGTK
ncbi:probable enoyl-CoA hydratase [Rhagoletis pomonella]|uniref:probable enoyl-CoA hydratase n=1 Tax=Rhagoletis pomonella TaxID=28610 RepID=UPI00177C8B96|nr:probable enoyl-CoA hydratase [Rhagoletis pomonella]